MKFDHDFFSTMAQVVPVFWLVLVVEYRMGRAKDASDRERLLAAIAVVISLAAESIAVMEVGVQRVSQAAGNLLLGMVLVLVNLSAWTMLRALAMSDRTCGCT